MSSSSDPPQLRLSLSQSASTFKRSFDQFGFDLESPLDSAAAASSSGNDEHRPGPSNTDRNKRARSSSVTHNSAEQAHAMDSSPGSSSSHTISSSSSHHPVANQSDVPPPAPATRYPQAPENIPVFPAALSGELSQSSTGLFDSRLLEASPVQPPPPAPAWSNPLPSTNSSAEQNDQFRISMERFHAFDSQISSIRSRPEPLPRRTPPDPPTLPPLTLSSAIEHTHSHASPVVSLPSVESLNYTSAPAQPSTSEPAPTAPPSATPPDQYHSDMSPLRFEEFGGFRGMIGLSPEQNSNTPSIDRPIFRRRHQSPPFPDHSEQSRFGPPFRRTTSRHVAENVTRNSTMLPWPSVRRGALPDDSDDEFGGRPDVQGRGSLDHPRSLLANRMRRSLDDQVAHPPFRRRSPPPFSPMALSQGETNSTYPVDNSRTQEPGRPNRHELWPFHSPPRLPVFAEAVRTLAERLGRARQRTSYAIARRAERSRSPGSSNFTGSAPPADYDWSFVYPDFPSSEDSPYELDLPMPSHWFAEDNVDPRPSMPASRIQREPRQVPWRGSLRLNEATLSESVWRRPSYTDHPPYPPSNRTSSGPGGGTNDTPHARAPPRATEPNTLIAEDPGWWRNVPHADPNYGPVHEHDMGIAPNSSTILNDRPLTGHPSLPMRDFIGRQHHPQPPPHIAPHEPSTRRSSEIYQSTEVGVIMTVDADVFRPDESSEVPFSNHAAALFGSHTPSSTQESVSHRRSDAIGPDRINESSYFPWPSRFEEDFALATSRRRANAAERRHRASPGLERSNTIRRPTDPPTASAPASRILDIEEFQHGPFRATLERLERQERQDQQTMMERRAEIDRLRSRLFELQSQERSVPSSRAPTLPPLRFDPELVVPGAHRQPSPTPPANIETTSSLRADMEADHHRRSWQRMRGTAPSWFNPDDELAPRRHSSGFTAPVPIPRAHSPPHPLPDARNALPPSERERERRRRPVNLNPFGPGDAEDAIDTLPTSMGDDAFITRSLARMRGEFQSTDGRREPRGNPPPWGMDPGRLALREPHADVLRGIRPIWATHASGSWESDVHSEIPAAGSSTGSTTDAPPVQGRRRRVNQSTLPPQGRNIPEDERHERPVGARRASSTSRYAAARRAAIRDPLYDRVQRMVRGGPRDGGLSGRYARRNPGDFIRDEDFDTSYESLLSLAATIGEVRPRNTPDHVINSLPSATFKEWRNAESDQRCPICLDDYQEDDPVMRLSDCSHWLHKNCLQQWLKGATTCPVCRERVRGPQPATRRERGTRADAQPGPSRVTDRSTLDIAREIREHVRMVFPDIAAAVSRSGAGPSGSGSQADRDITAHDGDSVDMSLDWDIAGPI